MYRKICFLTFAAVAVAPLTAHAQEASAWTGWQVAVDAGVTGARSSDVAVNLDPALNPQFTYTQTPADRSFQRERNLDRRTDFGLTVARLHEMDGWIVGVEGQVRTGGPEETIVTGPIEASPVAGPGPGTTGFLTGSRDTLTTDIDVTASASLRLRAGREISDNLLLSAYVGAAWMRADMALDQQSGFNSTYSYLPPCCHFITIYNTYQSSTSNSGTDSALGLTVGGIAELRLMDRIGLRAEAGWGWFDALEMQGAGDTHFSIKPKTYSGSLGLTYRF